MNLETLLDAALVAVVTYLACVLCWRLATVGWPRRSPDEVSRGADVPKHIDEFKRRAELLALTQREPEP